jgi:hypothetical protein
MRRSLVFSATLVVTIGLCCGCGRSAKPPAEIAITTVSVAKPHAPSLVHGKAFIGADGQEIPFTLVLPPAWSWSGVQADKTVTVPVTSSLLLTARELPDDEKGEPSNAAARRRLLELPDEKMLSELANGEKVTVRDRRLIQVGNTDAVWDVVAFQADEKTQPTRLEARCHLKLGDKQFTIEGLYRDERRTRTADDFDASQAEFQTIAQSFRVDRGNAASRPK